MQNLEFKCELRDLALARSIILRLGAVHVGTLEQTDTYYRVPSGRLKKRETVGEPTEYIFYNRPDRLNPKISQFTIFSEPQAVERFGSTPLPTWVVVRKVRELFLLGNVRVHLDQVSKLGTFLEFEAMVTNAVTVEHCQKQLTELRGTLAPVLGEPIGCGYSDLLAKDEDDQPQKLLGPGRA
ncbi:MAG: class IV adenylate cyclase [Phycisphaeraceae bacterium]|nr:class IV adenylate cyclase [Phycisphaeraceae bacterium]